VFYTRLYERTNQTTTKKLLQLLLGHGSSGGVLGDPEFKHHPPKKEILECISTPNLRIRIHQLFGPSEATEL
jgi:hypothetical protein